jgi:hypothetical protein
MTDNVAISAGTGTSVATDDIGGVHYQRVKLALGADGTANDASAGAGAVGTGTQRTTLASDDPAVVSLAVIDDWDESDRAKVNPIVGQAGIAAGAGAVGATVPRVTLASDDPAVASLALAATAAKQDTAAGYLSTIATAASSSDPTLVALGQSEYETVAASQTAQALGATGATADYIAGILVIPATTSPGNVLLLDNATSITVFVGGASSVSNLVPFFIPLGIKSVSGAWKITTGANVSCIGIGDFT